MNVAVQDRVAVPPVTMTDDAARRIAAILGEAGQSALRVTVEGGGCSGFQYKFDLVNELAEDDFVLRRDGAVLVIDPVSIPYMLGAEIDFVQNLMGEELTVNNPLAVASCGCGTSFAI